MRSPPAARAGGGRCQRRDARLDTGVKLVTPAEAHSELEAVLAHRPQLLSLYRRFYRAFWQDRRVPRRTLELTRLRIAAIHDFDAEWQIRDAQVALTDTQLDALRRGTTEPFDAGERAALVLAEQMPFAHHSISDDDVAAARAALGEPGCVALLTALAFFDVSCRLRLLFDLPAQPAHLHDPPINDNGALA